MNKHPRNVHKKVQKDISSRTKDIKQFSQLYTDTQTHIVNLELTPPEGGSAKNVCSNMVASNWTNEFLIDNSIYFKLKKNLTGGFHLLKF